MGGEDGGVGGGGGTMGEGVSQWIYAGGRKAGRQGGGKRTEQLEKLGWTNPPLSTLTHTLRREETNRQPAFPL